MISMNFDPSYIIAAFIAMGAAIVSLALAIAWLWRQQVKESTANKKQFAKLEEELRKAILNRCIRGGGDPRPCLKDQSCPNKRTQEETKQFLHPLVLFISSLFLLTLASCSFRIPSPGPSTPKPSIEQVIAEKAAIEQQRDQAITTSAQAKQAAAQARQEAQAAKSYADQKGQEAKRLDTIANDLRAQEISTGITRASWWLSGSGILAIAVGIFLFLRFGGKTAISIAISGAAALTLGIIGLCIAPHWILWAWIGAALLVVSVVAGAIFLLHQNAIAAKKIAKGIQTVKDRFYPKLPNGENSLMRNEVNEILASTQKGAEKTIQKIIKSLT